MTNDTKLHGVAPTGEDPALKNRRQQMRQHFSGIAGELVASIMKMGEHHSGGDGKALRTGSLAFDDGGQVTFAYTDDLLNVAAVTGDGQRYDMHVVKEVGTVVDAEGVGSFDPALNPELADDVLKVLDAVHSSEVRSAVLKGAPLQPPKPVEEGNVVPLDASSGTTQADVDGGASA